jgi:glyoxylase-like metal-dependent hydrolase (beta-lactamase superfamily II)
MLIRPTSPYYLTANSLLFFDEEVVLLDAGRQENNAQLQKIQENVNVDKLLFSHYHIDHILGSHLFPNAKKLIHENEIDALKSLASYFNFCLQNHDIPIEQKSSWVQRLNDFLEFEHLESWDELKLASVYPLSNNSKISLGITDLEIIHLPGHSPGHSGVYDPISKVLFIGDIEISSKFGPWYGWPNSDLIDFRKSVRMLIDFIEKNDVSIIISSHFQELTKDQGQSKLKDFYSFFDIRKERILEHISTHKNGVSIKRIAEKSLIYKRKERFPPFVREFFESMHVEQHVRELIDLDIIQQENNVFKLL